MSPLVSAYAAAAAAAAAADGMIWSVAETAGVMPSGANVPFLFENLVVVTMDDSSGGVESSDDGDSNGGDGSSLPRP